MRGLRKLGIDLSLVLSGRIEVLHIDDAYEVKGVSDGESCG